MISLKRREDRREWFEKTNPWLEFDYFWGIDAANVKIPFVHKFTPHFKEHYFSIGSVGAALSHRAIMKRFVRSDDAYLAIFEDDVRIDKEPFLFWYSKLEKLEFDFLFFGALFGLVEPKPDGVKLFSAKFGTASGVKEKNLLGAYGYIVSKEGAIKYLKKTASITHHALDCWADINRDGDFRYLCTFPNVAHHTKAGIKSDISGKQQHLLYYRYRVPAARYVTV